MIDPTLPLVDLHRHLDGTVRLETILELGRQHNLPLPAWDIESLRPFVQVTTPKPGVMAFLEKFEWMTGVLVDEDACRRIAYENVEDACEEGIDYIELRFSPYFMSLAHGLSPAAVTAAVVDGALSGQRDFGTRVNLIGIISRTYGVSAGFDEVEALLSSRDAICALDLAGDEANWPANLFVEHFKLAQDAGWHVTIHAGESAGAGSIWQALDLLGAERLGHAVRAPEDKRLMARLAERKIPIECNLTSNVQTSTVNDYKDHPIRLFMEEGILATINTDDPGISGIDLIYEYNVAAPSTGLTKQQIRQAQMNGLQAAFLSEEEKKELLKKRRNMNEKENLVQDS
jgi:adenosine deaminase